MIKTTRLGGWLREQVRDDNQGWIYTDKPKLGQLAN